MRLANWRRAGCARLLYRHQPTTPGPGPGRRSTTWKGAYMQTTSREGRSYRPGKGIWQITRVRKAHRQDFMQSGPLPADVCGWRSVEKIFQLERVTLEIVEFVFNAVAVGTEINRVGPFAGANGPDVRTWIVRGKKERIVE